MFRTAVRRLSELLLILSLLMAPMVPTYAQANDIFATQVQASESANPANAHSDDDCSQQHQIQHHHSNSDCCGLVVMGLPASQPDTSVPSPSFRFHTYTPHWQAVELENLLRPPKA